MPASSSNRNRKAKKAKAPRSVVLRNDASSGRFESLSSRSVFGPAPNRTAGFNVSRLSVMKTGMSFSGSFPWNSVDLTIPLYNVGYPGSNSSSYSRMADAANYISGGPVCLQGNALQGQSPISRVAPKILSMFSKVIPTSFSLHYRATCATSANEPLYFGYNMDPNSPAIFGYNNNVELTSSAYTYLQDQKYARVFAPWEDWDMPIAKEDVASLQSSIGFVNPMTYNDTGPTAYSDADRNQFYGVCAVKSRYAGHAVTHTGIPVYGTLYLKASVKLIDFGLTSLALFGLSAPNDTISPTVCREEDGSITTIDGPMRPADFVKKRYELWVNETFGPVSEMSKDLLLTVLFTEAKLRAERSKERQIREVVTKVLTQDCVQPQVDRSTSTLQQRAPLNTVTTGYGGPPSTLRSSRDGQ